LTPNALTNTSLRTSLTCRGAFLDAVASPVSGSSGAASVGASPEAARGAPGWEATTVAVATEESVAVAVTIAVVSVAIAVAFPVSVEFMFGLDPMP